MDGYSWTFIIIGAVLLAFCVVPMLLMRKHHTHSDRATEEDPAAEPDRKPPL